MPMVTNPFNMIFCAIKNKHYSLFVKFGGHFVGKNFDWVFSSVFLFVQAICFWSKETVKFRGRPR